MTHVLVTGRAGCIGSHACKALKAAGYIPVTYDSLVTGWEDAVKFGPSKGATCWTVTASTRCSHSTSPWPSYISPPSARWVRACRTRAATGATTC